MYDIHPKEYAMVRLCMLFVLVPSIVVLTSTAQTCGDALFVMHDDLTSNGGNPHPCIRSFDGTALVLTSPNYYCSGWAFQMWPGVGYLVIGPTVSSSRIVYDYDAWDNGAIRIFVASSENGPWNQIDNFVPIISQCVTASTPVIAQGVYVKFYQNPPSGHNALGPVSIRSIYPENPFPVELTSFVAALVGSRVRLTWRTATEIDNYGFEVQRRFADDIWTSVGFVHGHGTVNTPHVYTYDDTPTMAPNQPISYRLRQIDRDGAEHLSPIVTVIDAGVKTFGLQSVYPNPSTVSTNARFALSRPTVVTLSIIDRSGREVRRLLDNSELVAGTYAHVILAESLPSGEYFVWLRSATESSVLAVTFSR
jgi:hypothetical protein